MGGILPKLESSSIIMITTPLFFLVFLVIVVWVYRKSRRDLYEQVGQLPLDENGAGTE